MLMSSNPYQSYRQIQIDTAGPLELVVKLYDGAIRFLNQAKRGMNENNIALANEGLKRAQDIIEELNVSLNMDAGEVSAHLRSLYEFMNRTLVDANIKKDPKSLDDVISLLTTLRGAWAELNLSQKKLAANG